jgi:hypothetical protein
MCNGRYRIDSDCGGHTFYNRANTQQDAFNIAREECSRPGAMTRIIDLEELTIIAYFWRGKLTGKIHANILDKPQKFGNL